MENTTLVILAGGKSSRFGRDKSLEKIDGKSIVERTVEKCLPVFDEVMISSNRKAKFGIPGVPELSDVYVGMGPLGGIHSALLAAKNDAVFFAACDMPFFSVDLAQHIVEAGADINACVPRVGEKTEPLFGVYRKALLPLVVQMLEEGDRSLHHLLARADARILDCTDWVAAHGEENAFFNMNYQADLETLKKMR